MKPLQHLFLALFLIVPTLAGFGKEEVRTILDSETILVHPGFVLHMTAPDGGFGTGLIVQPVEENPGLVAFYPMSAQGHFFEPIQLEVNPGETRFFDLSSMISNPEVTHLRMIGSPENVTYTAYYFFKDRPGSRAQAPVTPQRGSHWRFFPGNWDHDFDGLVMVNYDGIPGRIVLNQYKGAGELLHSEVVAEALPTFGKVTYLLGAPEGSAFVADQDTWFELVGDVNYGVLALRGALSEQVTAPLWSNPVTSTAVLDVVVDPIIVDKSVVGPDDILTLRVRVAHYFDWDLSYQTSFEDPEKRLTLVSKDQEPDGSRVYVVSGFEADTTFAVWAHGSPGIAHVEVDVAFQGEE